MTLRPEGKRGLSDQLGLEDVSAWSLVISQEIPLLPPLYKPHVCFTHFSEYSATITAL
jgi:hypothetical protein